LVAVECTACGGLGCTGIALGTAGIMPVEDTRGSCDLYGKPLHITHKAVADNLVSAAQLLMGKADEGVPCVLVRGASVKVIHGAVEMPLFLSDECIIVISGKMRGLYVKSDLYWVAQSGQMRWVEGSFS